MSLTCADDLPGGEVSPGERLDVLFGELAELTGQRNAIDGQIVDIIAEIDRDGLAGATGARSVAALVAWKTGCSPRNATTIAAIAARSQDFPTCVEKLREGSLSADQVGVIAERAGAGSDQHYAELAASATVTQLRTAIKLEPRPKPEPEPLERSITRTEHEDFTTWRLTLSNDESAQLEAALNSHHEAQVADHKRRHNDDDAAGEPADDASDVGRPPFPTMADAFMALVRAGWDSDVAARPHGAYTTVIAHLDVESKIANLHLGPILSDADRQFLTCDATVQVWFEREGIPIGCGRTTRTVNRRLRRALEHRDHGTCVVPGCGATRGLQAHHVIHWENGGLTELENLVLVCPYHHRMHHKGQLVITGPATRLTFTDADGRTISPGSLARPPTTGPPDVAPYAGPTGDRAQWWWYQPWEPPSLN